MRADTRRALLESADRTLTPREREVVEMVAKGLSNKQIADAMGLKIATIKAHMGTIFTKTRVHNRVELTLAWLEGVE